MSIFEAILRLIEALWQGLLGLLQPLVIPDWGWLVVTLLPLVFLALLLLYLASLVARYAVAGAANANRLPPRLVSRPTPPPGLHVPVGSWWPVLLSVGLFVTLFGLVFSVPVLVLGIILTAVGGWGWLSSAMREWERVERGAETAVLPAPGLLAAELREPPPGLHVPTPSWWPVYASLAAFFLLLGLVFSLALVVTGVVLGILALAGWYVDANRELRRLEAAAPAAPHVRDPLAVFPRALAVVGVLVVTGGVGAALLPSLLPAGGPGVTAGPSCTPSSTIRITAKAIAFDVKEMCVPAEKPFTIAFDNQDDGVPHNVAIYDSPARAKKYFGETPFPGVKTVTYQVPALPAGSHYFVCDVHPNMFGTVTAVASSSGPGGAPAGSPAAAGAASP